MLKKQDKLKNPTSKNLASANSTFYLLVLFFSHNHNCLLKILHTQHPINKIWILVFRYKINFFKQAIIMLLYDNTTT